MLLRTGVSRNGLLSHGFLASVWSPCWVAKGQVSQRRISGPLEPEVGDFEDTWGNFKEVLKHHPSKAWGAFQVPALGDLAICMVTVVTRLLV